MNVKLTVVLYLEKAMRANQFRNQDFYRAEMFPSQRRGHDKWRIPEGVPYSSIQLVVGKGGPEWGLGQSNLCKLSVISGCSVGRGRVPRITYRVSYL